MKFEIQSDDIFVINEKQYRVAMVRNYVLFLTAVGAEECLLVYPWHANIKDVAHMAKVAHYQGFEEHNDSGDIRLLGEDCDYMSLSPTKVKPLKIEPISEPDPDWFEDEEEEDEQ